MLTNPYDWDQWRENLSGLDRNKLEFVADHWKLPRPFDDVSDAELVEKVIAVVKDLVDRGLILF